jgi:hypothetical protein
MAKIHEFACKSLCDKFVIEYADFILTCGDYNDSTGKVVIEWNSLLLGSI